MKNNSSWIRIGLPVLLLVAACTKKDDYKQYLEGGEIVYTGKADSLKVHPGYERAQLSWLLISDPNITHARVYWDSRRDSTDVDITRGAGVDTIRVMLENLAEGAYTFEVLTMDDEGHTSVPATVSGKVYGSKYEASLLARGINKDASMVIPMAPPVYGLNIVWKSYSESDGLIGMMLSYTDANDVPQTVIVPAEAVTTMLMNYVPGSNLEFRTLYQPDSLSIDTFYSPLEYLQF